ncbi:MAG: peptide deformylase [Ignavibacteriae bacterium]|nr:peptide deformylase [Ignavibacteriota bacterium]
MAVREILLLGNPILRTKCEKVRNFNEPMLRQTIDDLRDTLDDFRATHGFGRGIAAPQIGITQRVIFINIDKPVVLINPEIIKRSRQMMMLWDDCFSFQNILAKLKRHLKITVNYHDEAGKKQILEAVGGLSELLQHENDHVEGILAIDHAIDSKHIILRSEWKKLTANTKQVYQL